MRNTLLTTCFIFIWTSYSLGQIAAENEMNFELRLVFGISKYDLVVNSSSSYYNGNIFNRIRNRIDLEQNSIYGGFLLRKSISPVDYFFVESGLTYRTRGSSNEAYQAIRTHNLQIPLVLIYDTAPKKKLGVLLKAGGFGSFSFIQNAVDILASSEHRKFDFGYMLGIGCKIPIQKKEVELWSQWGSGSYFRTIFRLSPGGFRYNSKERNRFFEFGMTFPLSISRK